MKTPTSFESVVITRSVWNLCGRNHNIDRRTPNTLQHHPIFTDTFQIIFLPVLLLIVVKSLDQRRLKSSTQLTVAFIVDAYAVAVSHRSHSVNT